MQEPILLNEQPRIQAYSPLNLKQMVSCNWTIQKFLDNGKSKRKLLDTIEIPGNTLVGGGSDIIWKALTTVEGALNPATARMGIGNSSVATTTTMTDLQGTNTRVTVTGASYVQSSTTWQYTWTGTFPSGSAEFTWNEFGLFEQAVGGRMFNRRVFNLGTKATNQSWVVSATIGFNQSGYNQNFVADDMTDTGASSLVDHVGNLGANWIRHVNGSSTYPIFNAGGTAIYCNTISAAQILLSSGIPSTPDQIVNMVFKPLGTVTNGRIGILLRADPTASTYYTLYWVSASNAWLILKSVAGSNTTLSTTSDTLTVGTNYTLTAKIQGSTISLYRNGTLMSTVTDTAIAGAGRAGIYMINSTATLYDESNGFHIQHYSAYNLWQ